MAYRKSQHHFYFADLAVDALADKNRALSELKQFNATIDWNPIAQLLEQLYHNGKRAEGGKAYPPLLLFRCLMLQKWFQIPSDPDLEIQINDCTSFKSFLVLPMDQQSPDHSTFSRFRGRLSKKAMVQLNSALLSQFDRMGITINEGIAVDARLIKSSSKPVSNQKLDELRQKLNSPEGRLDKIGLAAL